MNNRELIARHQASLIGNYGKLPAVLVRGRGSLLFDADGKEFVDFFAGFGGTILGHAHPALVEAVTQQAQTLWAVGNQFYNEPAIRLAEQLKAKAFDGRAFFCHSGAEANEAAIKLARISAGPERYKIISMLRGFHGRTLGALSATPTPEYQRGFGPMMTGFSAVPYNDLPALMAAMDDQTAGVLVEPIQGEGGVHTPDPEFLPGVRKLCDQRKVALIFDEVWTGVGRTGRYFGHQHYGVTPDIMSMGKALGGGLPVGGILAKPAFAEFFQPGTHGCTLGGNPICAATAARIFEVLEKEKLCAQATANGAWLTDAIAALKSSKIKEIRGKGLFIGLELNLADAGKLVPMALERGLVLNVTHKNVVRICPAVNIPRPLLERGLEIFTQVLAAL
jgi:predicted acetylornithine/succinylornithine family transaminase